MDLVQEDQRDLIFLGREEELKKLSKPLDTTCFRTSKSGGAGQARPVENISDQFRHLGRDPVQGLVKHRIHAHPQREGDGVFSQRVCWDPRRWRGAVVWESHISRWVTDFLILYNNSIYLSVISHAQRNQHRDVHRFEKISNIIKQFKLSCSKLAANFQSMEVRNSNFSSFIDVFTANTYVMVILSDSHIPAEAILINIRWEGEGVLTKIYLHRLSGMRGNTLRSWRKIISFNRDLPPLSDRFL